MTQPSDQHWLFLLKDFTQAIDNGNASKKECEEMLLDILQDLFSEQISETRRLQMILFIQENVEILVPDCDSAEQAAGSLLNIFHQLQNTVVMLKSHILTTVTTIVTVNNIHEESSMLFEDILNLLIDTVLQVNNGHPLLRKTCCDCLCEIEKMYPESLLDHLQSLYVAGKEERSFAFQSNMMLVSATLHNILSKDMSQLKEISGKLQNLPKMLSFLMEQTSHMSASGLLQVVQQILTCNGGHYVPPLILKSIALYGSQTSDIMLTLVACLLQRHYPLLFQDADESRIASKLLQQINMPQLPSNQRLLFQYYLQSNIKDLSPSAVRNESTLSALQQLHPTIFDELDIYRVKIESLCEMRKLISESNQSDELKKPLNYLHALIIPAQHNIIGRSTAVLFRGLFALWIQTDDKDCKESIFRFVEELTCKCMKFVNHTIDFIDSIEKYTGSACSVDLMKRIASTLLKCPVNDIMKQLDLFFKMLQRVCLVKEIYPLTTVKRLRKLCAIEKMWKCPWMSGNKLLTVCKNILLTNQQPSVLYETACLLWEISQNFINIDIKDHAHYYYLLIGNVSPKYYSELLVASKQKLGELAAGQAKAEITSTLTQSLSPITHCKKEYLQFTRVVNTYNASDIQTFSCENSDDLLNAYRDTLKDGHICCSVNHSFRLSFAKEMDDIPSQVFAITIKLSNNSDSSPDPEVVKVPSLSKAGSSEGEEGETVAIEFLPKKPLPTKFSVMCFFHDTSSRSWSMKLPSISLRFQDFFLPLPSPVSQEATTSSELQVVLYEQLWESIKRNQRSSTNCEVSGVLSVKYLHPLDKKTWEDVFSPYVIHETERHKKIGIFLPPDNHLLLNVHFLDDVTARVWIALDDWTLLNLADQLLANFVRQ